MCLYNYGKEENNGFIKYLKIVFKYGDELPESDYRLCLRRH